MKSHKSAGLVCAGSVSQSFVARLPALLGKLGPVKGSSLRVSRRIANALKAGWGVDDYRALETCKWIWIAVPEDAIHARSTELAHSVRLEGKIVILCDVLHDSFQPSPLRTAGALVATLNCVPESDERIFVAEGHPTAVAAIKKLLEQDRRKLIQLQPVTKPLYLSGLLLGTHLLLPWIEGAVESLRAAGFSRTEATLAVQAMGTRALRAYAKAGRKAGNQREARRLHEAILPDLEAIQLTDPHLSMLYALGMEELLGKRVAAPERKKAKPPAESRRVLITDAIRAIR
jgi:hypothetical protein